MRLKGILAGLAAVVLFLVIGCITEGRQAGRGSEVENELGVYGEMVDPNGKPLSNAKVKIFLSPGAVDGAGPAKPMAADSVLTDALGKYAFRGLDSGVYGLLGDYQSGTLVLLRTGIALEDSGQDLDLGIDTLRPPGRIRGRLLLGDYGKGAVICYIPGTSYIAVSDDSGRFIISGIPQGTYAVNYSAPGFLIQADSGVEVRSAKTTSLGDKQIAYDPADAPPAPTGLRAVYDTLAERVSLSWDPVPVSDLSGFIVYRDEEGFPEPVPLRHGFTEDPRYVDSSFSPLPDSATRVLTYRVKARDREANPSARYSTSVSVRVAARYWATTSLGLYPMGGDSGTYSIGDTAAIVAFYRNPGRRVDSLEWLEASSGRVLRRIRTDGAPGMDTLRLTADSAVRESLIVAAKDEGGTWQRRGIGILYLRDAPWADAGPDSIITVGDSVLFRGRARDRFGRIVTQEWDIGGAGIFTPAPDGRLVAGFGPHPADSIPCIFRAVDDDNQIALDTAYITVRLDAPVAEAGPDTVAGVGDTLRLSGLGRDGMGTIRLMEWDLGGKGEFQPSGDGTITWIIPATGGEYPCVFRVTDDDGLTASDTLLVRIDPDPPVADAGEDRIVSIGDSVMLQGRGSDRLGTVVRWEWDIGGTGVFRDSGPDTAFQAPARTGAIACILRVMDDDGQIGLDTMVVQVVADAPKADAGPDRTLSINDALPLTGNASQDFGTIVYWGWKCGSEQNFVSDGSATAYRTAPATPRSAYACMLKVMDDDGNADSDTVVFRIELDPPVAHAAPIGRVVEAGDTLTLDARGSFDGLGSILSYQWTLGDGAAPLVSSSPTMVANAPVSARDTTIPVFLKVVDDDGLEARDTLSLSLRGKAPLEFELVADSLPFGRQSVQSVCAAQGKIWVLAAPTDPPYTPGLDLFSSPDGIHWSLAWSHGPTSWEGWPRLWEYGNKLWIYIDSKSFLTGLIYESDDGSDWRLVTDKPPFRDRANATVSVFDGKMFLFSNPGQSGGNLGEVWSSVDGAVWAEENRSYANGFNHVASFVLGNQLFGVAQTFQPYRFSAYGSLDGADWSWSGTWVDGSLPPQVGVIHAGKVFLIDAAVSGSVKRLWESADGSNWKGAGLIPDALGGPPHAVEFQGHMWLFGANSPGDPWPGFSRIGVWRSK